MTAHPRSRGENGGVATSTATRTGSSPLTRGKQVRQERENGVVGLIPAHAGKTPAPGPPSTPIKAHPRSRGENELLTSEPDCSLGSSPLTRGKLWASMTAAIKTRLIPAHAGKTDRSLPRLGFTRAHPRSRGENQDVFVGFLDVRGSSPLTRGKLAHHAPVLSPGGLIPAHAGKTSTPMNTWRSGRAHPRSRGENPYKEEPSFEPSGSSPLTRGKLEWLMGLPDGHGLIPAHAGKTARAEKCGCPHGAHPRSRGENDECARLVGVVAGSSPLTRGKHPA